MPQCEFGLCTKKVNLLVWRWAANLKLVATRMLAQVALRAMTSCHILSPKTCVCWLWLSWSSWFCKRLLFVNVREVYRLMWGFCRVSIFVWEELSLHFVSVNIWQVMEHILSKIRANFLCLLVAPIILWSFVQTIVASQSLSLSFRVLLKEQWRGCELILMTCPANTYRHASLFAI